MWWNSTNWDDVFPAGCLRGLWVGMFVIYSKCGYVWRWWQSMTQDRALRGFMLTWIAADWSLFQDKNSRHFREAEAWSPLLLELCCSYCLKGRRRYLGKTGTMNRVCLYEKRLPACQPALLTEREMSATINSQWTLGILPFTFLLKPLQKVSVVFTCAWITDVEIKPDSMLEQLSTWEAFRHEFTPETRWG